MFRYVVFIAIAATVYADAHTIGSLIRSTLANHPSIASSQQMIQGAEAGVEGAKWGYFPTPSVDFSQSSGRNSATLRLDQPLWTGGKLDAALDAANARKNESEKILDETSYLLIENLIRYYRSYLQSSETLKALSEGKAQLIELKEMLERRIDSGVSSRSDAELIRSRIAQIDTEITTAQTNRELARYQIEILSGTTLTQPIEAQNPVKELENITAELPLKTMLETHPSLKRADAQIQIAEAERNRAKAVIWPNLSLRAEHQNGSVYIDNATTNNVVYVALNASPGAGLSAMSNIQSAESAVLQKRFEKQTKEKELTDALIRDYNDYQSAKGRLEGIEHTIDASEKVLESYKRLFIAGKRQWLDLVNSSRELTQNKLSMAELKATMNTTTYLIALKSGKINLLTEGN